MDSIFNESDFDDIKHDEQHEEVKHLLMQFIESVKEGANEKLIVQAVEENNRKLNSFTSAILALKIAPPDVNLQLNDEGLNKLRATLEAMLKQVIVSNESLTNEIRELNKTNKADRVFKINYGVLNRIENILVSIRK